MIGEMTQNADRVEVGLRQGRSTSAINSSTSAPIPRTLTRRAGAASKGGDLSSLTVRAQT